MSCVQKHMDAVGRGADVLSSNKKATVYNTVTVDCI